MGVRVGVGVSVGVGVGLGVGVGELKSRRIDFPNDVESGGSVPVFSCELYFKAMISKIEAPIAISVKRGIFPIVSVIIQKNKYESRFYRSWSHGYAHGKEYFGGGFSTCGL